MVGECIQSKAENDQKSHFGFFLDSYGRIIFLHLGFCFYSFWISFWFCAVVFFGDLSWCFCEIVDEVLVIQRIVLLEEEMDRRSWLWRRKSSEKSPGETESSGSISSHSERFSDDQVSAFQSVLAEVIFFAFWRRSWLLWLEYNSYHWLSRFLIPYFLPFWKCGGDC